MKQFSIFKLSLKLAGLSLVILGVFGAGCSSVPRSVGYKSFSSNAEESMNAARADQGDRNSGQFAGAERVNENIEARLKTEDCYRLEKATVQWGLLEPEAIYYGTAVHNAKKHAFIFVAPQLHDQANFPTPNVEHEDVNSVYRIDREAPHSASMVQMLQNVLGRSDVCVRIAVAPKEEKDLRTVLSMQMMNSAQAPKPEPLQNRKTLQKAIREEAKAALEAKRKEDAAVAEPAKEVEATPPSK